MVGCGDFELGYGVDYLMYLDCMCNFPTGDMFRWGNLLQFEYLFNCTYFDGPFGVMYVSEKGDVVVETR